MGMQVGGGGGGAGEDLNSEINVTPFVDVMLVLLIIFMVTAPMLTTGVELDLPDTEAAPMEDVPEGKLVLSVNKNKKLFLSGQPVLWADLEVKLSSNAKVQEDRELWIEADESLPYKYVVTAMARARAAGIPKLMLLTDPTAELDVAALDKGETEAKKAPPEQ